MSLWLGIVGSSLALGGNFESIATVTVGSGGASSIEFTSIPGTYQHLQIRGIGLTANNNQSLYVRLNSDSGANYANHWITGDGATARGRATTSQTAGMTLFGFEVGAFSTNPSAFVLDLLDYSSTSKNKVGRLLAGRDANGSGEINVASGLWLSTAAVTTLTLRVGTGNWNQYSTAALYGIKAP